MTTPQILNELADRVEKLDKPSRPMDAKIQAATCGGKVVVVRESGKIVAWNVEIKGVRFGVAKYTRSIDASVSLVPDGMTMSLSTYKSRPYPWQAGIFGDGEKGHRRGSNISGAENKHMPIAIVAAALRARASEL